MPEAKFTMNNMIKINFQLSSRPHNYPIYLGENLIENFSNIIDLSGYSSILIITDTNVAKHYLRPLKNSISNNYSGKVFVHIIQAGEVSKQIKVVNELWKKMSGLRLDRGALVINLGGGVVTDIGGFTASTYQRGVSSLNVPTTLEAMVDASIGGKTGINFENLKNYIGSFFQPKSIVIDINTLKTLPIRALRQGYAEVLKHGLIADAQYFRFAASKKLENINNEDLIKIIRRSIEIKTEIVKQDQEEFGHRKLLNFGHTVGHVLESLSQLTKSPLYHGEAIAIGIMAESKISELAGLLTEEDLNDIRERLLYAGLPIKFEIKTKLDIILEKLLSDKKNISGNINWTLLTKIGSANFNIKVDLKLIEKGVKYIL